MSFFKKLFGAKKTEGKNTLPQPLDEQDTVGVRDSIIKSKIFFQNQLVYNTDKIKRRKENMKNKKMEDENFDFSGYFYSFNMDLTDLITARYSKGESISNIMPDCTVLMETISRFWNKEINYSDGGDINFIRLVNSLCIGILGGVDKKYFQELSDVMQDKKFSDLYIDLLVHSVLPSHPVGTKLYVDDDKCFNLFVQVLQKSDHKVAEQLLADFLEKDYYTRSNLERYYNIHEFEGARLYYGYWCWEAAAIVKIKGLDDTLFKDNRYYPYDFVHYEDECN